MHRCPLENITENMYKYGEDTNFYPASILNKMLQNVQLGNITKSVVQKK